MIIKKDKDTIRAYFEDASNIKGGFASEVAFPENVGDVRKILEEANLKKTPVTISGGGTGTTGSRVPFGGIVISVEKLSGIQELSKSAMAARLGSGVMVEDLKNACEREDLFYTSHPTERTASVGGTIATNASGSRSFKYGPTRKYVKYLKMVLPTGDILEVRRGDRKITSRDNRIELPGGRTITIPIPSYKIPDIKNSAGYFAGDGMDLIDLFIGQEGTLSVITDVELELVKRPEKIFSCFVFFRDEADAWGFSDEARRMPALSIEYFDRNALDILRDKGRNVPSYANAAIFFEEEIDLANEDTSVDAWLKLVLKHNASHDDAWVAMTEKEQDLFTKFRHDIPEAINDMVRARGFQKLSTDIGLPERGFREMMEFYKKTFASGGVEHVIFGHIGECHVHTNLLPKSEAELERSRAMVLSLIKKGVSLGGTISAEHGVGKTKHKYLEMMYGRQGIIDMARIKKAFDPNCILGLDNIFPKELLSQI